MYDHRRHDLSGSVDDGSISVVSDIVLRTRDPNVGTRINNSYFRSARVIKKKKLFVDTFRARDTHDNDDLWIVHLPAAGVSAHDDPRDAEVQARTVGRELVAGKLAGRQPVKVFHVRRQVETADQRESRARVRRRKYGLGQFQVRDQPSFGLVYLYDERRFTGDDKTFNRTPSSAWKR